MKSSFDAEITLEFSPLFGGQLAELRLLDKPSPIACLEGVSVNITEKET
jgi:hypothetical protein